MSVKIAIIAHACRGGGGLFQTTNLLKAMKNVIQDDQLFLVCSHGYGFENIPLPENSRIFVYKGKHTLIERYWFELVTLPKIIENYKPDVIYSPGNIGLTRPMAPQVLFMRNAYLFYDKTHYPDVTARMQLRILSLKTQLRRSLPGTKLIFCQTPVVRERFSQAYNYPKEQIKVLGFPPPVEIAFSPERNVPEIIKKESGNFFILLMTSYMPHRNPQILIPLCNLYGQQLRQKQIKFITTVKAEDHPHAGIFLKEISKPALRDIIINVGELSRQDVVNFMAHSDIFWLPTLLECLSTAHLEAMSIGIPILAPDLDFARYICDDAAIYYDPWNVDSIFEKIMLMRDNSQFRQQLVERGKLQLRNSVKLPQSWNEVAAFTLQELRNIAEK